MYVRSTQSAAPNSCSLFFFSSATGDGGDGEVRRDTPPRDPDLPLDVSVIPSDLSGMRALWNVALEAEDATVVDQATRFLNRTHQVGAGTDRGWSARIENVVKQFVHVS